MRGRGGTYVAALGLAIVMMCGAQSETRHEAIALIVSDEWSAAEPISLTTLRRLYMGRQSRAFGRRIGRVHLRSGSPVREGFRETVLGRSQRWLDDYWLEQALTGGSPPPRELASAAEVIERVRAHPGAIGYLDHRDLLAAGASGVRVLPVVVDSRPLVPGDGAYPVRRRLEAPN